MDRVPEDIRWWVGGELDGDGSVGVYACRLKVVLHKSVVSLTTLQRFRDLFGGTIVHSPAANEFQEPQAAWILRTEPARQFCADISPYTILKKHQFQIASNITVGRTPIIATRNGVTKALQNGTQLHKLIADPRILQWTVRRRIKKGADFSLGGWSVSKLDKADAKKRLSEARESLMASKHEEHVPVTGHPPLAYFCGFFEADGCVCINGATSINVSVSQKYRSICDALRDRFEGRVGNCLVAKATLGHMWYWRAYGDNARNFLRQVEPFGFEKRRQMQLALGVDASNWQQNKAEMDAMKGRRKKREGGMGGGVEVALTVSPNKQ